MLIMAEHEKSVVEPRRTQSDVSSNDVDVDVEKDIASLRARRKCVHVCY